MGSIGDCFGNSVAESFGTLQLAFLDEHRWTKAGTPPGEPSEVHTGRSKASEGSRAPSPTGIIATLPRRYGFASRTRLKGVSVARRNRVNPASAKMSRHRPSPAWAPSASPTSWALDAIVQITVERP